MEECPFCGAAPGLSAQEVHDKLLIINGWEHYSCGAHVNSKTNESFRPSHCLKSQLSQQAELIGRALEVVRFAANGRIMIDGKLIPTPIALEAAALIPALEKALEKVK